MIASGKARGVYGIRKIMLDENQKTMRVEFDFTRLNRAVVAELLRSAGIALWKRSRWRLHCRPKRSRLRRCRPNRPAILSVVSMCVPPQGRTPSEDGWVSVTVLYLRTSVVPLHTRC